MQANILSGSDRFETQVYSAEGTDLFITINYSATPTVRDWVFVQSSDGSELAIEPFRGQCFVGVIKILKPYQFVHMEMASPTSLPSLS